MRHIGPYLSLFKDTAKNHLAGKDITILEIGVSRGRSTLAFLSGIEKRKKKKNFGKVDFYSIDIRPSYDNINAPNKEEDWNFIQGDSGTVEWDKPIDVLFIDGSHEYEFVKSDFEKYSPFVKPGGLIYMHDVTHRRFGVRLFWEEIKNNKIILPFNGTGLGIVQV